MICVQLFLQNKFKTVIFQAKLDFLDSEKEKEAEGGGFGPGAYINGSAVSKNSKQKRVNRKQKIVNSQ